MTRIVLFTGGWNIVEICDVSALVMMAFRYYGGIMPRLTSQLYMSEQRCAESGNDVLQLPRLNLLQERRFAVSELRYLRFMPLLEGGNEVPGRSQVSRQPTFLKLIGSYFLWLEEFVETEFCHSNRLCRLFE